MKRAGIALLLPIAAGFFLPSQVQQPSGDRSGSPQGRVILFVLDQSSFEELLAVPQFRGVARAGGAALMTTYTERNGEPAEAALAYRVMAGGRTSPGSDPPLTNLELDRHGIPVCLFGSPEALGEERGMLAPDLQRAPVMALATGPEGLVTGCSLPGVTFEDRLVVVVDTSEILRAQADAAGTSETLLSAGDVLSQAMIFLSAPRTLLLVVVARPSAAMMRVGDEVTPLLAAGGAPDQLASNTGDMHALASETTRRPGLVANVDVAPTILDFFDVPVPAEMEGRPIGLTDDPAPFALHRRHLEHRRIRLPVQIGEVAYVSFLAIAGMAALAVLAAGRRVPVRLLAVMRFLALCGVALPIPLLLGGLLPRMTYVVVVPFVVLSVVGLAALSLVARWTGPTGPVAFLGAVGLGVLAADALFAWRGAGIPLLGGTMFDGVRFYGLPNAFVAVVLAGALFVASRMEPFRGFALLVAAGLFAGFPSLGANVGGSVALFAAAGLWWVLRTRTRFGLREAAFTAGMVALGLGMVLLANRYLGEAPTHATRFVENETTIGQALRVVADRLSVGIRMLNEVPPAYLPLIGLPVALWLALARPGPIGTGLEAAGEAWRHALVALTVSGILAFLVEDTGIAAAGPVFLYAAVGLAYPAFLVAQRAGAPP